MALWNWRIDPFWSDPWGEVDRAMREVERLANTLGVRTQRRAFPAVNVWSNADKAVVTAEIPGMDKDDLDITVTGDVLTIRGSREPGDLADEERYVRQERGHGSFVRTLSLPFGADVEAVRATYNRGVLRIELPRPETEKPAKVQIKG
ncbi:MAG: Hsp20/alpha crystallin family protein [Planctomycetes bacterium]|nr:Hsp20/alpha crystallin family protein [Planctomycetota bacterium]